MKSAFNWLISDALINDLADVNDRKKVLRAYAGLALKMMLPLLGVSLILIFFTTWKFIEPSKHFAIDLKLDGGTLASYAGLIFSTVVALAGSLVAIVLALKSQQTSEETHRIEVLTEQREIAAYAREIKKELGEFLRPVEKAFWVMETNELPDVEEIICLFAARYLVQARAWDDLDGVDAEKLWPFINNVGKPEETKSIASTLKSAMYSANGFKSDGTRDDRLPNEPARFDYLERTSDFFQKLPVDIDCNFLKAYVTACGKQSTFNKINDKFKTLIYLMIEAYDGLEGTEYVNDIISRNDTSYRAFFRARHHIDMLENMLEDESYNESALIRFCLAHILSDSIHNRTQVKGSNESKVAIKNYIFWLIMLSLPAEIDPEKLYSLQNEAEQGASENYMQFIDDLLVSLRPLTVGSTEIARIFNFSESNPINKTMIDYFASYRVAPIFRGALMNIENIANAKKRYFSDAKNSLIDHQSGKPFRGAVFFWHSLCRSIIFCDESPSKKYPYQPNWFASSKI